MRVSLHSSGRASNTSDTGFRILGTCMASQAREHDLHGRWLCYSSMVGAEPFLQTVRIESSAQLLNKVSTQGTVDFVLSGAPCTRSYQEKDQDRDQGLQAGPGVRDAAPNMLAFSHAGQRGFIKHVMARGLGQTAGLT